jgi:prevent-host-death family protein
MPMTFTSREFNQDASRIKRAAAKGAVFITDRGRPAHVLMTIDEYERLHGKGMDGALVSFLESLPLADLDLTREPDTGRDAPF